MTASRLDFQALRRPLDWRDDPTVLAGLQEAQESSMLLAEIAHLAPSMQKVDLRVVQQTPTAASLTPGHRMGQQAVCRCRPALRGYLTWTWRTRFSTLRVSTRSHHCMCSAAHHFLAEELEILQCTQSLRAGLHISKENVRLTAHVALERYNVEHWPVGRKEHVEGSLEVVLAQLVWQIAAVQCMVWALL